MKRIIIYKDYTIAVVTIKDEESQRAVESLMRGDNFEVAYDLPDDARETVVHSDDMEAAVPAPIKQVVHEAVTEIEGVLGGPCFNPLEAQEIRRAVTDAIARASNVVLPPFKDTVVIEWDAAENAAIEKLMKEGSLSYAQLMRVAFHLYQMAHVRRMNGEDMRWMKDGKLVDEPCGCGEG